VSKANACCLQVHQYGVSGMVNQVAHAHGHPHGRVHDLQHGQPVGHHGQLVHTPSNKLAAYARQPNPYHEVRAVISVGASGDLPIVGGDWRHIQ
jgi:hypothetical protein